MVRTGRMANLLHRGMTRVRAQDMSTRTMNARRNSAQENEMLGLQPLEIADQNTRNGLERRIFNSPQTDSMDSMNKMKKALLVRQVK